MDLKKTVACCVILMWIHVGLNIVLINHAFGAKIVQQEENFGVDFDHVQTFTLLTALGTSENFTTQVANLSDASMLFKTQPSTIHSICTSIGSLWIEYSEPNFKSRRQGVSSLKPYFFGNELSCRPLNHGVGERIPASIKYIGHSQLNRPGLSLFSEENFDGDELYFDGSRLMYTFEFKSYGFTGPNSWSIYSGGNFTGDSLCLDKRYDAAITMDEKLLEFGIGSVQLGCQHENSKLDAENIIEPEPVLILYYNHMRGKKLETFQLYFNGNELRLPFSRSFHAYSILGPIYPQIVTTHMDLDMEVHVGGSGKNTSFVYGSGGTGTARLEAETEPVSPEFDERLELSWTIYSGINFDGHSKCLSSMKTVIGSTNQFKEMNNRHDIHLMIGSIRFGCEKKGNGVYNVSPIRNHGLSLHILGHRNSCFTNLLCIFGIVWFLSHMLTLFEGIK